MLDRLLKLSISISFFCLYKSVILILNLLKKQPPGTIVILNYHSVKSEHREKFAQQMDELLRISNPVFADIKKPLNAGQHHVAVTFDDGFQNVLDNALPELYKRKIPVIIFVPTGFLGERPAWINESNHEDMYEMVVTHEQLKNLSKDFVKIGSHCITHPDLTLLGEKEVLHELVESKKYLESVLNVNIHLLAFPFGSYNQQIIEWSRKAGYKRVFSDIPTFPSSKIGFIMGRLNASTDDWILEYKLKLLGAYQWLHYGVKLKRNLRTAMNYILKV